MKTPAQSLAAVPTLDELATDPRRAEALPTDAVTALLSRCTVAQSALMARLVAASATSGHASAGPESDRLLAPEEAATILGVTPVWLYRHARSLPFTRRLSRKVLRFSETGLRRWQATRRP